MTKTPRGKPCAMYNGARSFDGITKTAVELYGDVEGNAQGSHCVANYYMCDSKCKGRVNPLGNHERMHGLRMSERIGGRARKNKTQNGRKSALNESQTY